MSDPQILLAGATAPKHQCMRLQAATEMDAIDGGIADDTFVGDASCQFSQIANSPTATPHQTKTAIVVSRDPAGYVFRMKDAQATCSFKSQHPPTFCGKATLLPSGVLLQVEVTCNTDPTIDFYVYKGSATLRLDGREYPLGIHDVFQGDLQTGVVSMSSRPPTPEEVALFEVQRDAVLADVSFADPVSLLQIPTLLDSNQIVAPQALKSNVPDYGVIGSMCGPLGAQVLFYPTDPSAFRPQLYWGACPSTPSATVYGVAIYQSTKLLSKSSTYRLDDAGGHLVRHDFFPTPKTIGEGQSTSLFSWDGTFDKAYAVPLAPAPSPAKASKALYIAKFVYTVPPNPTPKIQLVEFSFGGAPFPFGG